MFSTPKSKRKHLNPEELKALSLQTIEKSQNAYQVKVDKVVDKIEQRLAQGKFTTTGEGYLCVKFWGEPDSDFIKRVDAELTKRYSVVNWNRCFGGLGIEYRMKP